jgi:hypothetical protein
MSHIGFGRVSPFIFVRVYKEMSERKTIQINPELFKISKNTTRKKTPKVPKIELKSELKTQKQKTLRKNVLKMIREKQQDAYRELFDKKRAPEKLASSVGAAATFDKDFDSSLQFFSSLADKVKSETTTPPNITLRQYPPLEAPMGPIPSFIPTADMTTPTMIHTLPVVDTAPISLAPFPTDTMTPLRYIPGPAPLYGCLKNGSLPTYRTRKNMAQATPYYGGDRQSLAGLGAKSATGAVGPFMTPPATLFETPMLSRGAPAFQEQSQKFEKIHQGIIQKSPDNKNDKHKQKIRYKKRKKIFKRTYKVGRSKTEPKIGVLVSNRTIRKRISTEAQLLKQTPIHEVRRFLIKKGFIKVGTNAPNDVLRKMYETVSLVCGEIQNHNPENLLYNFIHDKD